jgi:xanthine permease XanP
MPKPPANITIGVDQRPPLTSATGLLLIFHVATGHQQTIAWRKSEDALGELNEALEKHAKEWGLTRDVIERGVMNTKGAIALLGEGQLLREPVSMRAAERDNSLEIELTYKGLPMLVPDLMSRPDVNEETAMAAGLQDIAIGVHPDRSSTTSRGPETIIRLSFHT